MVLWFTFLLFQQPILLDLPAVSKNPYTSEADLTQGRKLYGGRCAGCHGPTGDGGKGANLAVPVLARGQSDLELYRTIRYGLPETEMPSHNMTQREIWQLTAFVRTLGQTDGRIRGDARRGAELVRAKGGCLQCHVINGEGGLIGPSLTDVGARRSPSYLHAKLLDPGQEPAGNFSQARISTRDGRTVSGIRVNEDTWSIQIRTAKGELRSFWKQDVTNVAIDPRTLMPSYRGKLDPEELQDIAAYLSALGGRQ